MADEPSTSFSGLSGFVSFTVMWPSGKERDVDNGWETPIFVNTKTESRKYKNKRTKSKIRDGTSFSHLF
jgi:hypothetical protein